MCSDQYIVHHWKRFQLENPAQLPHLHCTRLPLENISYLLYVTIGSEEKSLGQRKECEKARKWRASISLSLCASRQCVTHAHEDDNVACFLINKVSHSHSTACFVLCWTVDRACKTSRKSEKGEERAVCCYVSPRNGRDNDHVRQTSGRDFLRNPSLLPFATRELNALFSCVSLHSFSLSVSL